MYTNDLVLFCPYQRRSFIELFRSTLKRNAKTEDDRARSAEPIAGSPPQSNTCRRLDRLQLLQHGADLLFRHILEDFDVSHACRQHKP